jgi:hypothetical protein
MRTMIVDLGTLPRDGLPRFVISNLCIYCITLL